MNTYPSRIIPTVLSTLLASGCVSQAEIEAVSEKQFEQMQTQMPLTSSAAEKAYAYCVSRAIISQSMLLYGSSNWAMIARDTQ